METKHTELMLYFGSCDREGCSEGIFLDREKNEYSLGRIRYALSLVEKNICMENYGSIRVGYPCFVRSPKEAEGLIKYAQKNIKGAFPKIKLTKCMHGNITFSRIIYFSDWEEEQKEELIQQLQNSKYSLMDERKEDLERILRRIQRKGSLGIIDINDLEKRINEIDSTRMWREALTFF